MKLSRRTRTRFLSPAAAVATASARGGAEPQRKASRPADGFVRDNRVPPGAPNGTTLMSLGCGAHYTLGRFIDFRVENGWQLRRVPGETRHESRLVFSAVVGD